MTSFGSQGTPSRCSPRAKGKDKVGNQSRARQRLQLDERACWTTILTEAFLQCCVDEIDNFGRVSTSLDKQAWLRVVDDFNKRTNSNLQITQLKNRWDQLKRDWGAWRMLIEDRSITGIGWDPNKKTVSGPDHWWATMILRNKLVAKFKDAGLKHAELMERVFRDVTATGAGAYVPRSRQERMTEVESDDSHELQSDGTNAVHSPDPFGPAVAKRFKMGSGGSGTQSYKSRVAASTAAISESINELIQTVKTSEHRVVTHDAGRDLHIEAIKKLSSLPIFKDENNHEVQELHWWAIQLFEKTGKYYLVDAGYPNAKGYMAPYKGYMYHQDDFRQRRRPVTDSNERFNRVHSSLRSCVERAFGVWKARWAMMKKAPKFKLEDHKKFILISMALHNYIRIHCPSDKYFRSADMENEEYVNSDTISRELHDEANEAIQSDLDFAVVNEYMDSIRNEIRNQILLDHRGRGHRKGNVMRSDQGD